MTTIRNFLLYLVCVAFAGCATNVRFAGDELPSGKITGEEQCQVPQHWKALALQGVDTRSLEAATIVQVEIPPEWVGDTLGWFVEGEEDRTMEQYPRQTWQAIVIDQRGKKRFFPAVMKNPLTSRVLSVLIPGAVIPAGETVTVYVPSGAYTKLLTTTGEMLRLPSGKDCLGLVNEDFVRSFPSPAQVLPAGDSLIAALRADFPKSSRQRDGVVYSHSLLGLNKQVIGDLRQVTQGERIAQRGLQINPLNLVGTGIGVGITMVMTASDHYVGPFGERQYSVSEMQAALGRYLKAYNASKERLEIALAIPIESNATIRLDFSGRKSGWEIGALVAPQVSVLWEALDQLKERFLSRTKEKGALPMKEVVQSGLLLPSSPPQP